MLYDKYNYELTDHLGNVRAVIRNYNNAPDVLSHADYYPHGGTLPGRVGVSSPVYRSGYQGQFTESDPEVPGTDAFDLRLYDETLARWSAPDPYGQYASPYLAMGNNPVNMVDPSGGIGIGVALGAMGGIGGILETAEALTSNVVCPLSAPTGLSGGAAASALQVVLALPAWASPSAIP
jgi:RHS repeat-associated protein